MNNSRKITLSLLVACGSNSICCHFSLAQAERPTLLAAGYGWQSQQASSSGSTSSNAGFPSLGASTTTEGTAQAAPLEGSMLYGQMNQVLNGSSSTSAAGSTTGLGSGNGVSDSSGSGLLNSTGSATNALGASSIDSSANGVGLSGSGSNGFGAPGLQSAGFGQSAGSANGLGAIESGSGGSGAFGTVGIGAGGGASSFESGSTLPDTTNGGSISGFGSSAGADMSGTGLGTSPDSDTAGGGTDSNASDTANGDAKEASSQSNGDDPHTSNGPDLHKENTPMRRALADLRAGRYEACLAKLNEILRSDSANAQAHYLKGVTFVMTRRYPQAADEYRNALADNPAAEISKLARQGLAKLER